MKTKPIYTMLIVLASVLVRSQTVILDACTSASLVSCGVNTLTIHNTTVTPGAVRAYFYTNMTVDKKAKVQVSANGLSYKTLFVSSALTGSLSTNCPNYGSVTYATPYLYYNQLPTGTSTVQTTQSLTFSKGLYIVFVEFYKPAGDTTNYYKFTVNFQDCADICPNPVSINLDYGAPTVVKAYDCYQVTGNIVFSPIVSADSVTVNWNYGDGTTVTGGNQLASHSYTTDGTYTVSANVNGPGTCTATYSIVANVHCTTPACEDCIESFSPSPDSTYIVSGWIREDGAGPAVTTYTNSKIIVNFFTGPSTSPVPTGTSLTVTPTGAMIDGWQKGEEKFTIPSGATAIQIVLKSNGADAYYDDIRVFPFNGSMKSYVYDPNTMRLMAELDERNYASMYEYDEEGKLIRVKKETERGIMTIKESRNSAPIK